MRLWECHLTSKGCFLRLSSAITLYLKSQTDYHRAGHPRTTCNSLHRTQSQSHLKLQQNNSINNSSNRRSIVETTAIAKFYWTHMIHNILNILLLIIMAHILFSKCFAYINLINLHDNHVTYILLLSPFHKGENWDTERLRDLPKVSQLPNDGTNCVEPRPMLLTTVLHCHPDYHCTLLVTSEVAQKQKWAAVVHVEYSLLS